MTSTIVLVPAALKTNWSDFRIPEEDKKYGESNGEIKIPEHLTHKVKLQEKVKGMLKDMGKAKEQMDKAKTKIENEKVK